MSHVQAMQVQASTWSIIDLGFPQGVLGLLSTHQNSVIVACTYNWIIRFMSIQLGIHYSQGFRMHGFVRGI